MNGPSGKSIRRTSGILIRLCAMALLCSAAAPGARADAFGPLNNNDPPARYFPGKYFEWKAQFYLRKKDYAEALRLFELSGYWADKVAQYNVGIMYFNGVGIPTDKARGAAWLGIAAEVHDTLADAALQAAYSELTPEQRQEADAIFQQLDVKYGDAATLPRALARYRQDAGNSVFGFGVAGAGTVTTYGGADSNSENSVDFVRRMDAQRDALIAKITGRVTVGGVQALPVPDADKHDASHTVLQPQSGQ